MAMKTDEIRSRFGRLAATAFLIAALALLVQPTSLAAQKSKDKGKDKDKDQEYSQMGAQCAPGTGEAGGTATASAPASTPTDEIIRQFAQHESDFKLARANYTYSQEVLVEDVAPNPGEYRLESEIVFTPQGRRYEEIKYAPQPSLHDFTLSPEDMKDLENIQPFVLTSEDLPKTTFSPQERRSWTS